MKDAVIMIVIVAGVSFFAYRAGYNDAQTRFELKATVAAQIIKEAVSRASDTLSGLAETISTNDSVDDAKLQEIEDAANAAGAVCTVPVERLRGLDAITN